MTREVRDVVDGERLAYVATVRADGTPAVSPKGTLRTWGERRLVFLHLHSEGTVDNLRERPAIEVNVVDPIRRRGWRIAGTGRFLQSGAEYQEGVRLFGDHRSEAVRRSKGLVVIDVHRVEELLSPAYAYTDEAELSRRWAQVFLARAQQVLDS